MNKYKGARKGIYKPRNPSKWVNNKIVYRSGLEQKWFTLFDLSQNVLKIGSENIVVPYYDPVKKKMRKYFVDIVIQYKNREGETQIKLIEIKSSSESVIPKKPKRLTENYKSAVMTYITNDAKWKAAEIYAQKRGWEFAVLTERQL